MTLTLTLALTLTLTRWVLYELSLSKVVDAGKVTLSLTATLTLIRRSASGWCY